ncbi:Gfo/Idh/MocA family protein [Microlunatus soli]|uniref:Predicted dehydrogenase n=1 Tax=Microlunatus soli TaxID=630515 RepID=A0A1H1X5Q4_9ACTN|nr:Gfo/Idh/MocA family oxidoreductase [Microlunatus soli]SDT04401.1 Predicted dehydrogenase [Microlunatus soli]
MPAASEPAVSPIAVSPIAVSPIAVGIVGLGRSGWNIHAAGLEQLPQHFRVAAVADQDGDRRAEAEQRFGCATYAEPADLLADSAVELVVVATPSHTHVPVASAALTAGKHVLIEKPAATSTAEVDQLTELATAGGRVVTAFQNQRLDPSFLVVRDLIDDGRIGEPLLIRRTTHRYTRRDDWQTLRRLGGGELPNTALHFLDQLMTLIPDTELQVFADLRHTITAGDAEDHVKLTIRPDHGPVIDLESSMVVASPQDSWFVVGTLGTITGTASRLRVRSTDISDLPERQAKTGAAAGRTYPAAEDLEWTETEISVPPPDQRTTGFYEKLYDTIRNGTEPFVTMASVRRVVEVMTTARRLADFP